MSDKIMMAEVTLNPGQGYPACIVDMANLPGMFDDPTPGEYAARLAAAAQLAGRPVPDAVYFNTCYSHVGEDYGITLVDGRMAGMLGRAVVVIGADGTVTYTELVPEIAAEPDYDAALAAALAAAG
jgi:hypothetical protein